MLCYKGSYFILCLEVLKMLCHTGTYKAIRLKLLKMLCHKGPYVVIQLEVLKMHYLLMVRVLLSLVHTFSYQ